MSRQKTNEPAPRPGLLCICYAGSVPLPEGNKVQIERLQFSFIAPASSLGSTVLSEARLAFDLLANAHAPPPELPHLATVLLLI